MTVIMIVTVIVFLVRCFTGFAISYVVLFSTSACSAHNIRFKIAWAKIYISIAKLTDS